MLQSMSRKSMPSGFDPMGGNRFSEKDMRRQRDPDYFPIQPDREMV
jgi:hypothetical protein